jgi:hypothetical protein
MTIQMHDRPSLRTVLLVILCLLTISLLVINIVVHNAEIGNQPMPSNTDRGARQAELTKYGGDDSADAVGPKLDDTSWKLESTEKEVTDSGVYVRRTSINETNGITATVDDSPEHELEVIFGSNNSVQIQTYQNVTDAKTVLPVNLETNVSYLDTNVNDDTGVAKTSNETNEKAPAVHIQTSNMKDGSYRVRYTVKVKKKRSKIRGNDTDEHLQDESPAEPLQIPPDHKVILLWTTYKGRKNWWWLDGLGTKPFTDENCTVSRCVLTDDRTLIDKADMVVFYYHDMVDWPPVR